MPEKCQAKFVARGSKYYGGKSLLDFNKFFASLLSIKKRMKNGASPVIGKFFPIDNPFKIDFPVK